MGSGHTVGVVGLGTVGGTVSEAFRHLGIEVIGYDPPMGVADPMELARCSVIFVCVPTPAGEDGELDVAIVRNAIEAVAPHLRDGTIIAVKSTVPPGTCDALQQAFPAVDIASVPEFLVASAAMETFTRPDRVVIGTRTEHSERVLRDLMGLAAPTVPVLVVRPIEAEFIKLCSNAMLSAKVIVANELAAVCERFGVSWPRIQNGVGLDRRIGAEHTAVSAEGGFSGGCLPKDLDGLIAASRRAGYDPTVLVEIAGFNARIRRDVPVSG